MLVFSLLAVVIVLNYELVRKRAPLPLGDQSLRKRYHPAGRVSPGQRSRQPNQAAAT